MWSSDGPFLNSASIVQQPSAVCRLELMVVINRHEQENAPSALGQAAVPTISAGGLVSVYSRGQKKLT